MCELPKLKELLNSDSFRNRTAMYIGENKISSLKSFLDGIHYCFEAYYIEEDNLFSDFNEWTAKYYGWQESTAGWKNIILMENENNEEKALVKFFEIYDSFTSTNKEIFKTDN